MDIKSKLFDFFVVGSGILALSASGMVAAYSIVFKVPIDIFLLLVAFFVTYSSYYINHRYELKEDVLSHGKRTNFILENPWIDYAAVFLYLLAFLLCLQKNILSAVLILVPPMIVILYTVRFHPRIKRFKDITFVKNFVVALTWAVYAFLTATWNSIDFTPIVYVMALFIMLRFFVNTLSFDLRDVKSDEINNVPTLPVVIGKGATIAFLLFLNLLAAIFLSSAIVFGFAPLFAWPLVLINFYGIWYTLKFHDPFVNLDFLCDVVIDGEFVFWPLLLFLGLYIFGV